MPMQKVIEHFRAADPILFSAIQKFAPLEPLRPRQPSQYFENLCREIIHQQLSSKAGNTIYSRVIELFPKKCLTPEAVLEIPEETLRSAGPSRTKVSSIKDLAQKVLAREVALKTIDSLDDEGVIEELITVKGIGRWTAEMFLMFSLGREDVFSYGDLGLNKAIKTLYKFTDTPRREDVEPIVTKWSPYRSYACLTLWNAADS